MTDQIDLKDVLQIIRCLLCIEVYGNNSFTFRANGKLTIGLFFFK